MMGSYVLLIELSAEETITVGSLKAVHFRRGYYAYVGSAMSGFKARLNRHLKVDKRLHWHIDYLLQKASIEDIIICEARDRIECAIAQAFSHQFGSIAGFGSSDCKCRSHLFFSAETKQMKAQVMSTIDRLGIRPELIAEPSVTG